MASLSRKSIFFRLFSCRFVLFSYFLGGLSSISQGLKLTAVKVPSVAIADQSVQLECRYVLEGDDVLYAVKWYKDSDEFYRYVLAEKAPISVFSLPGILVNLAESNDSRVTLSSVNSNTSATFRCEVSAEAPSFQTVSGMANMTVIRIPESGPLVSGLKENYFIGDELDVNCTFPPLALETGPQLRLNWHLNYQPIENRGLQSSTTTWGSRTRPWINLKVVLTEDYFDASASLHVSCIVTLGSNFRRSSDHVVKLSAVKQQFPTQQLRGPEKSASYASGGNYRAKSCILAVLLTVSAYVSF